MFKKLVSLLLACVCCACSVWAAEPPGTKTYNEVWIGETYAYAFAVYKYETDGVEYRETWCTGVMENSTEEVIEASLHLLLDADTEMDKTLFLANRDACIAAVDERLEEYNARRGQGADEAALADWMGLGETETVLIVQNKTDTPIQRPAAAAGGTVIRDPQRTAGQTEQPEQAEQPAVTLTPEEYAALPITVTLDGQPIKFDQPPIIENGRTLVPLRFIFEALGADVDWDNDTQTVTAVRQDTVITLTIGSNLLFVNGKAVELDVPAKLVSDRTLVPVRAVSESFACEVDWINETKTVVILQQS